MPCLLFPFSLSLIQIDAFCNHFVYSTDSNYLNNEIFCEGWWKCIYVNVIQTLMYVDIYNLIASIKIAFGFNLKLLQNLDMFLISKIEKKMWTEKIA